MRNVSLSEGLSTEQLVEIYADPFISRIQHDHRKHYPVFSPAATYVGAWINGVFSGAYLAIEVSTIELDVHVLLKKNAVKHSRQLGEMFLDWCFEKPDVVRITGQIPDWIPTARNHCEKMGFKYEGTKRAALIVNGQRRNILMMGILREEWEARQWAM